MSAQLERGRAQTMRGFSCVCAGMLLMALPTGPPASYGDRGINRDSWKMASVLYFSSKPVLSSTEGIWGTRAEDSKCPPKEEKQGAGGGSQVLLPYLISWECKFVYTTEI